MRVRSAFSFAAISHFTSVAIYRLGVLVSLGALYALAVSVAAGCDPCPACRSVTPTAPGAAHFVLSGTMIDPRIAHSGTLVNTGQVLMAGGYEIPGTLDSAETYDPSTGTFTATAGAMTQARDHHTATLLNDNAVLIAGGDNGYGPLVATAFLSAEIFDPTTNTFSTTGSMFAPRTWHTATLLPTARCWSPAAAPVFSPTPASRLGRCPTRNSTTPPARSSSAIPVR